MMIYLTHAFLLCGYSVFTALGFMLILPMFGVDITEFSIFLGEVVGLTLWTLYLVREAEVGLAKVLIYPLILSAYAGLFVAYSWIYHGTTAMVWESIGWILLGGAILRLISIGWDRERGSITGISFVVVWVIISIGVATITAYTPHTIYDLITRPLP